MRVGVFVAIFEIMNGGTVLLSEELNFYPLNIEHKRSPPYEGGVAAASADGVVLSFTRSIPRIRGEFLTFIP